MAVTAVFMHNYLLEVVILNKYDSMTLCTHTKLLSPATEDR